MNNTWIPVILIPLVVFCMLVSGCVSTQSPETGTVRFESSPVGAEIYFDNEYRGTTPGTLSGVVPGNHTLEYRYSGYTPWAAPVTVVTGTSQFYAVLSPETGVIGSVGTTTPVPQESPVVSGSELTVKISKDPMIIGESAAFSGSGPENREIVLTLYGPGSYSGGVVLAKPKSNEIGLWSYTWTPGTKIQSGSYTIIAGEPGSALSARAAFKVIGGGEVTVIPNRYAASQGSTIKFSGRCTSGADNVRLVLYGPGRYSGGSELGIVSVLADDSWSYSYVLEAAMPTGTYTITVYDVPKTASGSSTFTVGYIT